MKKLNRKGTISLTVLILSSVVLVTGVGFAGWTSSTMSRARNESQNLVTLDAAQAVLEQEITRAHSTLLANHGQFISRSEVMSSFVQSYAPGCVATATVQPLTDPSLAWATANVTYNGKSKSVRSLLNSRNLSIWNNAIFAGTGASGQSINGNVDIRGSVHLLGDGEPFTDLNGNGIRDAGEPYQDSNGNGLFDPPLTAASINSSFSGSGYIGNNYSGMSAELRARIPALPVYNGVSSLGTEARVKRGRMSLSGSSTVGTSAVVDGGASKSTIDGSYVTDGYTGSGGASSVFSDNGTSEGYDVSHLGIKFPYISGVGAETYVDSTGTNWATQEAFLDSRTLTIPVNTIDSHTAAFEYGPDALGNWIRYTPPSGHGAGAIPGKVEITGVVRVVGDLTIGESHGQVKYDGSGTFYSTNDIHIHSDFLPIDGRLFPTTARVGLIAKRNLNLATGGGDSQLKMAGAFYAQGRVVSAKQNEIAGTFVGNFYDMGSNVPNIYAVPSLPYNMPPAMPGDTQYHTIRTRSWRKRW